jgi:formamidopyrimidine-DNA glycosylase
MPELPEVETVRRDLAPHVAGRTITGAAVYWDRSIATPGVAEFLRRLPAQRVVQVDRRGKFLLLRLAAGGALAMHLRMTGRLLLQPPDAPDVPHLRVRLWLDDGRELRFVDQRKFGRLYLLTPEELPQLLSRLGPEPLDADAGRARFVELLRRRRGALKPLLLNQAAIAGLGNIYANEALFRAGLHPLRRAESLSDAERDRLYDAARDVLEAAIQHGGTTLATFVSGLGTAGRNQAYLLVHQRAGQPCPRCGTPIERIVVGQRGTFLCPHCQPAP